MEQMTNLSPTMLHVDLVVKDMDASVSFYTRFLNYKIEEDCIIEGEVAQFLSAGLAKSMRLVFLSRNKRSVMVELIQLMTDSEDTLKKVMTKKLNVSLSYVISDLNELQEQFGKLGLKPASQVFDIKLPKLGNTKILFYRDPDDYLIEFIIPGIPN